MDATLQPLLDRAFGIAEATLANEAIDEARRSLPGARPTSYEVLVKPGQSLTDLAVAVIPRLIYHLESRGARPPQWGEIFLSLFVGERLHFVLGSEAMPLLLEAHGLTADEAFAQFGTKELRHAITLGETSTSGSPLLIGAGPPDPRKK